MLQIVQFTKIDNEFFFFIEGLKKAFNETDIVCLADMGVTNISSEKITEIISR